MALASAVKSDEKRSKASAPASNGSSFGRGENACGAAAGIPRFLRKGCGCDTCAKRLQAKFLTDTPRDRWEQEADRVAEAATSQQPSQSYSGGLSPLKSTSQSRVASEGSGAPLSGEIRRKVEPIIHSDLSHVRVHSGPGDQALASGLGAKAFTHGSDIWLGPNQSGEDIQLMAHEATHVVQQGAARATPSIQRQSAVPSERPRDGSVSARTTDPAISAMVQDLPPRSVVSPPRLPDVPDPAEVTKKNAELQGHSRSAVAKANKGQPALQRAAIGAKAEANKPAKPGKTADAKVGKGSENGKGVLPARHQVSMPPFRAPTKPEAVKPPELVAPVDAAGKALKADPAGDAYILTLAAQAQAMRLQGFALQERAAQERHNASVLEANIHLIHEGTIHATDGLTQSEDHLAYRRDVLGQTSSALKLSEDKAEMVASKAPDLSAKGAEGKEKSSPMAGEAKDLVAKNASATPDDEDAAEKSQEQGGKIGAVSSDLGSMDSAITQTKAKADGLSQESAQAKETNTKTHGNVEGTRATLDQTKARLTHLAGENATAKTRLAQSAHGPQQVLAGAAALDKQGAEAINASKRMEDRLHAAQKKHVEALRTVPASKVARGNTQSRSALVQRQVDPAGPAPAEKINFNLAGGVSNALPSWLTGEEKQTEQQRIAAQAEEQKRRDGEIQEINAQAHGDFTHLSAADKAGIALSLTSRHIFGSVSSIKWPDMLGKLAQGLVDPRMALMGVVSGLSMTLSGAANLLSIEQWKQDPLGNLLKSAADIATGITIILGSITALAMAIIAILVLAAIFTFGALGPVAAAVIPFCSTVVSTVGPWTLEAAAIALDLNLLVMIKDLVSAATAKTASDLQVQSDHVTEDAKNAGNMALQIGMAGAAEAGGEALMSTKFGETLAAGARDVGEAYGIAKPGAEPAAAGAEPATVPATAEPSPTAPSGSAPGSEPGTSSQIPELASSGKTAARTAEPGTPPTGASTPQPEALPEPATSAQEGAEPSQPVQPAAEPVIAAQEPGAGGHTVKVTAEGECLVCTTCKLLPEAVEEELTAQQALPEERAAVEQKAAMVQKISDPAAKAKAGAEVQAEAQGAGTEPGTGGPAARAAAEARLRQLVGKMKLKGYEPADLGYNKAQWERFLEDTESNPQRAARDLEGRIDRAVDRAGQTTATREAQQADIAQQADDVREELNYRTSAETTGPERTKAAAEAVGRTPDPEHAPDDLSGSDSHYDDAARARELYEEQLKRPSLRDSTKQEIFDAAENREPDGRYRDPDGVVRDPPYHFGHEAGHESRRLILQATEQGMTQAEFNDFINEHPELFRIESAKYNLSHAGEEPGID